MELDPDYDRYTDYEEQPDTDCWTCGGPVPLVGAPSSWAEFCSVRCQRLADAAADEAADARYL